MRAEHPQITFLDERLNCFGIVNSKEDLLTQCLRIKHFDEPSVFGINEGRISKLWLKPKDGSQIAAAYERGWDKRPETKEAQEAVDTLCTLWN